MGEALAAVEAGNDPPVRPGTVGAVCGSRGWGAVSVARPAPGGSRGVAATSGQELTGAGELVLPRAIGEQAIVADTHEAGGYDVEEEAAEEFLCRQFHDLGRALRPRSRCSESARRRRRQRRGGNWQSLPDGCSG